MNTRHLILAKDVHKSWPLIIYFKTQKDRLDFLHIVSPKTDVCSQSILNTSGISVSNLKSEVQQQHEEDR